MVRILSHRERLNHSVSLRAADLTRLPSIYWTLGMHLLRLQPEVGRQKAGALTSEGSQTSTVKRGAKLKGSWASFLEDTKSFVH